MSTRLPGGRWFLSIPNIYGDKSAFAIVEEAINLIPLLSTRSLQNSDKRHLLSAIAGLSSNAAAIALHLNKGPAIALGLLEAGRPLSPELCSSNPILPLLAANIPS